ncbi:hypothetical protein D3C78_1720820 [compost metagenome]
MGHRFEFPLGGHRHQLHLCCALQVIQIVPGFGNGRPGDYHPVVFQEQDVGVAHDAGNPVAFGFIKGQAVVMLVHRRSAIKLQGRLAQP